MPALYPYDDQEKDTVPPTDFRARYSAQTAGMPANLATIASNNLAATDASLAKVNAVARMLPQQPDYSTTFSSTPSTDVSAPSSPSISALHSDDIASRRSALDDERKQIQAKLGLISPREAGFDALVLAPVRDRPLLLHQLQRLDAEDSNLLRETHYNAIDAAKTAHENFTRQTHINAANDFADMANELADLHKNTKPGSPEFATGALDIAKRHPAGFQTQAGQTLFRSASSLHDNAATLEDKSYWQRFGQSFKEASQIARKRGVDVQYDDQGFPSTALTASVETDNQPERKPPPAAFVQQAAAVAELKAKKDAAYNANPKADLTTHDRNITIQQARLDAMKEALGMNDQPAVAPAVPPVSSATPAPSAAPSATPDLKTLAQKALNDPKASEAHKAAAKKILGL